MKARACIDLTVLYEDQPFADFLARVAVRNLLDFDDYRQSVFCELLESEPREMVTCRRAAWRVAISMRRTRAREWCYPYRETDRIVIGLPDSDDRASVLWEDNHVLA